MKFLHRPVQDFEGITRNFEQLETIFTGVSAVRFGTATVTWDGINFFTNVVTVTHGLPITPACVFATGNWDTLDFAVGVGNVTATTLGVRGQTPGNTVPAAGTSTVYWLAIG